MSVSDNAVEIAGKGADKPEDLWKVVCAYSAQVERTSDKGQQAADKDPIDYVRLDIHCNNLSEDLALYKRAYYAYERAAVASATDRDQLKWRTEFNQYYDQYEENLAVFRQTIKDKPCASRPSGGSHLPRTEMPRLPQIEFPKFDGTLVNYTSFWDQFKSQIDDRQDLPNSAKLQYLRSQLEGKALELIRNIKIKDANYETAKERLKTEFGDTDQIKRAIFYRLADLEPCKIDKVSLEQFRLEVMNLTAELKDLDNWEVYEWSIAGLIQRKLANSTVRELTLKYQVQYFGVDQLVEGLGIIIAHMGSGEFEKPPPKSRPEHSQNSGARFKSPQSKVGIYYAQEKVAQGKAPNRKTFKTGRGIACRFCGGDHTSTNCTNYSTYSSRFQRLKELKLCLNCCGEHYAKDCMAIFGECRVCRNGRHHAALCSHSPSVNLASGNVAQSKTENKSRPEVSAAVMSICGGAEEIDDPEGRVALATAMAVIVNGKRSVTARMFFDAGSQGSFITRELVAKLELRATRKSWKTLEVFGGQTLTKIFDRVDVCIKLGGHRRIIKASVVDHLPKAIITHGLGAAAKHLRELGLKLADPGIRSDTVKDIGVLIGSDYLEDFLSSRTVRRGGVRLAKTPAGYVMMGRIAPEFATTPIEGDEAALVAESVVVMKIGIHTDPFDTQNYGAGEEPVHKLWDLDVVGIQEEQPPPEHEETYQDYLSNVEFKEGQYWVRLPWKPQHPELPTNFRKALGQLNSLVSNLTKKGLLGKYDDIIKEQVDLGFIEKVPDPRPVENTHYLPHMAVTKESATTPIRVVFNCSSQASPQEPSLNDCLFTGPSLTQKLGDVLLKFRTEQFAYAADISKAFLRIGLKEQDRDYTRFLWVKNRETPGTGYDTYRFKAVLFGATSSPFLLQATIDYHLANCTSPIKDLLKAQFYVDNMQGTTSEESLLLTIYNEANREMQIANMPLREWATNNSKLRGMIQRDYQNYEVPAKTSILGLEWSVEADQLRIKGKVMKTGKLTKRKLLSNVQATFDPLGMLSPVTIRGRMLVQQAWNLKLGWDETLPDSICEEWSLVSTDLEKLSEFEFPRSVGSSGEDYTLHVFCDASSAAYGAVAYLESDKESNLVTSRARVAPLKECSIPKLELTALLLGVRLGKYVKEQLNNLSVTATYIWSDSEVALQWVKNNKSKLPYVRNRVKEIRELQSDFKILYVPTDQNPADLLSRGVTCKKLSKSELWFKGPAWLRTETDWPEQKFEEITTCLVDVVGERVEVPTQMLFDPTKYSTLSRLIKVTDRVFSFVNKLCDKVGHGRKLTVAGGRVYWLQQYQREAYPEILEILATGRANEAEGLERATGSLGSRKLVHSLGLFLDHAGLIRCRGRLHNANLSYGAKHPVLLDKDGWLTKLVVQEAHIRTMHGGFAETLTYLRQNYWVTKGRAAVKKLVKSCIICRRYDGRTLKYPGPPPLPQERVQSDRPFETVGIDYTGAITLKNPEYGETEAQKVYVCLFTCATTRAVHLELAKDMAADTFVKLFRRFAARFSCPRLVISDNGTSFKAASKIFKNILDSEEMHNYLGKVECEWKFIAPRAPWQGGFYERMVGTVKRCLRKVLHNKRVSTDELRTVLAEIEARINNRPLTYVQEELDELEALTPNHMLFGRRIEPFPTVMSRPSEDPDYRSPEGPATNEELHQNYNNLMKVLEKWNQVWRDDYLTALREHFYGADPEGNKLTLYPGDLVLVESETSRANWPLGLVVSIHPDRIGRLRMVKVKINGVETIRTINKLLPLEVHAVETGQPTVDQRLLGQSDRPIRRAALASRAHWEGLQGADLI